MPLVFIAVYFAESGRKGRRLLSGIQVGDISHPQSAEGGNALLTLLRYDLCHGGGGQGDAVPEDEGGHIPQVG